MERDILHTDLSEFARKILIFLVPYSFLQKFLSVDLGLPSFLSYVTDVLLLLSLVFFALDTRSVIRCRDDRSKAVLLTMLIFVGFALFTAIIHLVSPLTFIWATRNTCRFFLFFYLASRLLNKDDIERIFYFLNAFIIVNTFVIVFQYAFVGLRMDYLNGLVGSYAGGNSVLNMIMCAVTIWHMSRLVSNVATLRSLIIPIAAMLITSALNETKIYFFELIIIGVICSLAVMNRRSVRRLVTFMVVLGIVSFLGLQFFLYLYPSFKGFLSLEYLRYYLFERSYNSSDLLYFNGVPIMNRFSSILIVAKYFLDGPLEWMTGLGFGSCEHSSFAIFDTEFYKMYGEVNYMGYSTSYLFLETGVIGLLLYLLVFVSVGRSVLKMKSISKPSREVDFMVACGLAASAIALITCVYNNSLRIETSGYLAFLLLVIPFIFSKSLEDRADA